MRQGSRSGFIGGSVTALGSLSSASLLAPTSWGSEKWNSSIMSQLEARGHCAHGIETEPGFSALASLILALSVWHAWQRVRALGLGLGLGMGSGFGTGGRGGLFFGEIRVRIRVRVKG